MKVSRFSSLLSFQRQSLSKEKSKWLKTDRRGPRMPRRDLMTDGVHPKKDAENREEVSGWWEAAAKRWTDGSSGPGRRGRRRDELHGEKRRCRMSWGSNVMSFNLKKLCWWRGKNNSLMLRLQDVFRMWISISTVHYKVLHMWTSNTLSYCAL